MGVKEDIVKGYIESGDYGHERRRESKVDTTAPFLAIRAPMRKMPRRRDENMSLETGRGCDKNANY